jgi:hypothetical protein
VIICYNSKIMFSFLVLSIKKSDLGLVNLYSLHKLGLAEIVRFQPTHPGSNPKFDVGVTYLWLGVLIDSESFFDRLCESQD